MEPWTTSNLCYDRHINNAMEFITSTLPSKCYNPHTLTGIGVVGIYMAWLFSEHQTNRLQDGNTNAREWLCLGSVKDIPICCVEAAESSGRISPCLWHLVSSIYKHRIKSYRYIMAYAEEKELHLCDADVLEVNKLLPYSNWSDVI